MLYEISDGTVSVGGRQILSHISFEIKGKEKIGIVGRNGAGKTTLLRLMAGELSLDRDDLRQGKGIRTSRKITVGMLHQTPQEDLEKTVEELLMEGAPDTGRYSRERYEYESEYDRIFTGFGFHKEEKRKLLREFSGGEQTKISLIRLLLLKPDLLLLDEPTNHLDIPTTQWLESYMQTYDQAVVFVSHDRFFLDQVVEVIYELENGRLSRYPGNYTAYRAQKRKKLDSDRKAYARQQAELERLEELIRKFRNKPRKAAFARSRKTIMDRMEKMEKPGEDDAHIFTGEILPQFPSGKWVLEAKDLKVGYDHVLMGLSMRVKSGAKIGIIGENGAGKTTLLRTIAGELPPIAGECTLSERTLLGYFDQQSAAISSEKTVLQHFHDLFPGMTEKEVRQTLGDYLFDGRKASVRVEALSGGEKARLVLCELLVSRPNLLLLDEPTNHMDIQAKETLESAFRAYRGTILFISHDRYFLRQVADAILVLDGEKALYYPFGYDHYLEKKRLQGAENMSALIRAEDTALLEGMRAVPEREKHMLREISTQDAWFDWQLRLAKEDIEEARTAEEKKEQDRILQEYLNREPSGESEKAEKLPETDRWTKACLAWFEIWEEKEEAHRGRTGQTPESK